jgi:hypothetical protein
MPSVYYSAVLPAPIETVWAAIRDFKALPDWHPAFCNSTIEDGRSSDAVGCVRSFHLKDGGHLREKLLALSDRNHTCTYAILESPLPLTDYVSTLRLLPVTDSNQTFAEWTSDFNAKPEDEAGVKDLVRSVYQSGLDALKQRLTA